MRRANTKVATISDKAFGYYGEFQIKGDLWGCLRGGFGVLLLDIRKYLIGQSSKSVL